MNTGTERTQARQELTQKPFGDYFQVSKENAIFIEKLASANPHALKILLFITLPNLIENLTAHLLPEQLRK